jgi:OmpA-like transmembrane domain
MRYLVPACACVLLLVQPFMTAFADDVTGLYVGGDVGASTEHFDGSTFNANAHDTGYKINAGFRPLSFIAGEVSYVDLGRASAGIPYVDTTGVAISALGFLPIPIVDVYGRIGVIESHVSAHEPGYGFHRDGSDLTYGIGAGMHWGSIGARVEYQRFNIAGTTNMGLTTAGLSWNFGWF